jgi:ribonucleoside-diphosphate reductase alpha chain
MIEKQKIDNQQSSIINQKGRSNKLLSSLGKKIFLDRYAKKSDPSRSFAGSGQDFAEGDGVLAIHQGQCVLGTVVSVSQNSVELKLSSGEIILGDKSNVTKPNETLEMMFQRVSDAVASAEENKVKWTAEFFNLLSLWQFVPGGRILSAAGNENLTYYNCFVLPSPEDCREGIIETLQQMVDIMSRGGGVGINISSLRPKDIPVLGVSGRSSGAVSWGALYSFATGLICQGGSRRGALGLVLNDWHPDVLEFVKSKRKEGGAFLNANISVAISDNFMRAVQNDSDWQLVFPDTHHPEYDKKWDGDLQTWVSAGYPVLTHKTIKAKELWDAIVEAAWTNGEPGVWFIDSANQMSNSHYLFRLTCTNPCFEEPLPSFGVCCLGSLNLPAFINNPPIPLPPLEKGDAVISGDGDELAAVRCASDAFHWDELSAAIAVAVRFLDDVISVTPYFQDDIEQRQKSERRIGLGTMGLAEALIRLGLRYGSEASLAFIYKLYGFIAKTAYLASVELAKEKGRFPAYDEQFLKSGFMKQMPLEVRDEVAKHGIRNMTLLTQAPTGSIATMVGTSTGIEPFFDWCYTRLSQLGVDYEYVKVYTEWKEAHPDSPLPDYFVKTLDITVDEHVAVQAAVQRWVDASISKTVNLPSSATKDDVSNVFKKLYESGCKGGTVYRDGSRKEQVLNHQESSKRGSATALSTEKQSIKELPYKRLGATVSMKTPSGTAHITMNHDSSGQPFEVFIEIGKAGSDLKAMAEAIGRLISLIFRLEPIPPKERALQVIEQLSGIGGARSVGLGKSKVLSLPDAVSKALAEHYELPLLTYVNESYLGSQNNLSADICPVCGQSSYVREEGCTHCFSCGFSEC